jgi:SNF2 family DNA or RNA helicase
MQKIMARNAVVARKEDALDLPGTTDVTIPVHLSAAERKAYAEMKDGLAVQLETGELSGALSRLTQMLRLRQITSGHLPDDDDTLNKIGDSKVETINSIVNDTLAGEKRVVIFCFFTHEIQALSKRLARDATGHRLKDTEVMTITGATSTEERVRLRQQFGSADTRRMVMVAQVKTMSLAVNELVTASHAVFGSLSQQRDDLIQARDRLDRIGQTKPVTFWFAIAPGTVDEVILRSHRERTNLETVMLRHIQGEEEEIHEGEL